MASEQSAVEEQAWHDAIRAEAGQLRQADLADARWLVAEALGECKALRARAEAAEAVLKRMVRVEDYTFRVTDKRNELLEWGMSLRDWFAGQALAGILANPESGACTVGAYADEAYRYADALLAVRKTAENQSPVVDSSNET